jgi:hypothetical protein
VRRFALLALLAAGCGSAGELPPAARPADSPALDRAPAGRVVGLGDVRGLPRPAHRATAAHGRVVATVDPLERTLTLTDRTTGRRVARVPAGVGPTHVVSDGAARLFVVDTEGDGLLLFRLRPELELVRRAALPGTPYGIAFDRRRHRLWITLTATNEVAELTANGQPRPLRRLPAVRQPDAVAVDRGRVVVIGRSAAQIVAP